MYELSAFSAEQAARLTGLSPRQLAYWDETLFYAPAAGRPRAPFGRIYSFRDLVHLRVIALLRKEHHVALQELRRVAGFLEQGAAGASWSTTTFYVAGRRVYFELASGGARLAVWPAGQTVLPMAMEQIIGETSGEIRHMQERTSEMAGRIERNRYILHNAPVLAGTRIPTAAVWDFARAGYDTAAIMREYPRLQPADVEAALEFERERRRRAA